MTPRPRKKQKRPQVFNSKFQLEHGLRVCERTAASGSVLSVSCLFCITFGREHSTPPKDNRKTSSQIKMFRAPWRTDHFRQHLEKQHLSKWKEYLAASMEKKKSFLETDVPYLNTMNAHFARQNTEIVIHLDGAIVDEVIGDLLFHPDDNEVWGNCMTMFESHPNLRAYSVRIPSFESYKLTISYLSAGLSFRQVSRVLQISRMQGGVQFVMNCSEGNVARHAIAVVSQNLQKISALLNDRDNWAFSLAFDGATCNGVSFLDVRIRLFVKGDIRNTHVLAIPLYVRHTGPAMFEVISKLLEALCKMWKRKLLAVSTDGAANMTGQHSGAVTRLQNIAYPGFYRLWCGAHQLDLIVQECVQVICNDSFYAQLTSLIGYLRRQQNLISDMRTTCPKVASTRWLSLGKVSKWLVQNRSVVIEYLEMKNPPCTTDVQWWIMLAAVNEFMKQTDICFKSLKGMDTTVHEQNAYFVTLVDNFRELTQVHGPLDVGELSFASVATDFLVSMGNFAATTQAIKHFVEDLGSWYATEFFKLDGESRGCVLKNIGKLFTLASSKVMDLQSERNHTNSVTVDVVPPVTPKLLVNLVPREFNNILNSQKERLLGSVGMDVVDGIEMDFKDFKMASRNSLFLQTAIAGPRDTATFTDAWKPLEGRFTSLKWFCGTVATIFPTTATVEADFSKIKREFDDYRQSLTCFSLEGILHAKQFDMLFKL